MGCGTRTAIEQYIRTGRLKCQRQFCKRQDEALRFHRPSSGSSYFFDGSMSLCYFYIYSNHVFGDLAAPLFAFILGMSLCVSVMNWKARGASDSFIVRRSLIRGVILFIIGLLYLLFIWGPSDIFDWDVLTMLGCSVIFLTTLRKQRPVVLVLIGLLIIISSPLLRDLLDYPRFWDFETDEFSPPFTLKEVFCSFFLNGYFPIFPGLPILYLDMQLAREFYLMNQGG